MSRGSGAPEAPDRHGGAGVWRMRAALVATATALALGACQSAGPPAPPAGTTTTVGDTTVTTSGRVRVDTGYVE
ncbi:MAG: hypothetical protein H0T75_07765 [Rhizobiales bacterium]|nr:hypothetical protein [Hyphomicrobiales bacterium]